MKETPFQQALLNWYFKKKRNLPWRKTTDPYSILVSEFMLQQTQVDRVIPKYNAFLEQFPTLNTLATASTADILRAWQGLGFNKRALRLQAIAKTLVEKHQGIFPTTEKELLNLRGIGDYTASAICSFAYNQDIIALDTNIRRIFHRVFFDNSQKANEDLTKELEFLAQKHLPTGKSRDWHNALMDLGATICKARTPTCTQCPLNNHCSFTKILEKSSKEKREKLLTLTRIKNKQGTFKDSNRYYRGKILDYLRKEGTTTLKELQDHFTDHYHKDVSFLLLDLEKDKLIKIKTNNISLPD